VSMCLVVQRCAGEGMKTRMKTTEWGESTADKEERHLPLPLKICPLQKLVDLVGSYSCTKYVCIE
jgi:hypothetical protein